MKTNKQFIRLIMFFVTLLFPTFLLFTSAKANHEFHTSLTRMDYNSQNKTVEISIMVFTRDLVKVLENKHQKRIDLEKTSEIDKLILNYLNDNFIFDNNSISTTKLKWVGKEITVDVAWLYVEIPFEGNLEGKTLQNSIFFETFPEQTNLVICKFEQKKADLLFKVGEKLKEIQVGGEN